jgi:hypothetical protein
MCMNCGCGLPYDKHGQPANIDANDLHRAGAVNDQSLDETIRHMAETAKVLSATAAGATRGDQPAIGTPEMES